MKTVLTVAYLVLGWLAIAPVGQANAQCGCPEGRICLWKDGNYQGDLFTTSLQSISNYQDYDFPGTSRDVNDDVSSLTNNTSRWVVFFRDKNYGDKAICVAPGKSHPRLGDFLFNTFCGSPCGTMDNRLSSHSTYSSRPPSNLCSYTVE